MIHQMTTAASIRPTSRPQLPLQSAPIDRNHAPAGNSAGGSGVEADGWWDDFVHGAKDVIGIAQGAAPVISGLAGLI